MADAVGAHPVANPGTVVLLKAGHKNRKYTATEKVQILDFADSSSDRKASDTFGVDRHSIRDWRNKEEAIRRQAAAGGKLAQRARVEGPKGLGRKLKDPGFDKALFAWVEEQLNKKVRLTRRLIFARAEVLLDRGEDGEAVLKLSRGWLDYWLKRHQLTQRRTPTVCQKPPSDYAQVLMSFVMYVAQQRKLRNFTHIYAMDETAVWLDASPATSIARKGAKE
ncbi:pogo transposable element with KRAB domain-like protein, partial [Aphelenchoides avenae]